MIKGLVELGLLAPVVRSHPGCDTDRMMKLYEYDNIDGLTLRCMSCHSRLSIGHGSIFENSPEPLSHLLRIILFFSHHISVTEASHLLGLTRQTLSGWYKHFREKMMIYFDDFPITYERDDLVEIDEMWLDNEGRMVFDTDDVRYNQGGWLLGFVGRL